MAIVISHSCFRVNSYASYANVGLGILVASTETCGWLALGLINLFVGEDLLNITFCIKFV